MRTPASIAILAIALLGASTAHARTIWVSAEDGHDVDHDGLSSERPLASISAAAALLQGGDELIVGPGVYYEHPEFVDLGSSEELPVLIRAEPTGGATISGMWPEAARGEVAWQSEGGGIWSAEHGPVLFGAWGGHFLFRYELSDLSDQLAECVGEDCLDIALPPYGLAVDSGRVYVRLPQDVDPNGESILLSPPSWDEEGWIRQVVAIDASPWVILDGFRIEGSGTSCVFIQPDSHHPTIRNTVFNYCVQGVRLPAHGLVEWSEYAYPGLHDFVEDLRALNGGEVYTLFRLVKEYHSPVVLEGAIANSHTWWKPVPHDCEFRFNFMHQAFDGEWLGSFEFSESHHNVYLYNYDNHIEFESYAGFGARELRFHHSLLLAGGAGPISHQQAGIVGPQHVYRNVIYGLDAHGWQSWTQIKSLAPNAVGGVFYTHNLIWGDDSRLMFQDRQHWTFRNNLFVFSHLQDTEDEEPVPPDSDYNLLVTDQPAPWLSGPGGSFLAYDGATHRGQDPADLGFVDPTGLDFGITATSPARDAGVDLPDYNAGAPGGPDLGPFEVEDSPGPDWPRARTTTFSCEPPERWNGPTPPLPEGCEDDPGDDDDSAVPPNDDDSAGPDDDDASALDDDDSASTVDPTEGDPADAGCGCSASMSAVRPAVPLGLSLWFAALWRRGRRRPCSPPTSGPLNQ